MNEKELRHELRDKNSNHIELMKKLQKQLSVNSLQLLKEKRCNYILH